MKKLIVVTNNVAGTGKSTCARGIHHLLQAHDFRSAIIESDPNAPRIEDGFYLDMGDQPEVSEIVDILDNVDAAVLDLNTGSFDDFSEFFSRQDIEDVMMEMEVQITFVVPTVEDVKTLESVSQIAAVFGETGEFVTIATPVGYDEYQPWEGSTAQLAMQHLNATEIAMPEMNETILDEIESRGLDLATALEGRWELPRFLMNEVQGWMLAFNAELEWATDSLLPDRIAILKNGEFKSSYGRVALGA
ncbi:MAG: hypothetical protein ACI9R3_003067 [Verrucomicrobiales bacterium]|jgi:hypothetical protein